MNICAYLSVLAQVYCSVLMYIVMVSILSNCLQIHRLVIVDDHHHVIGVLSLSDILKFLVLTSHTRKASLQ